MLVLTWYRTPETYRSSVFANGGVPELYGIGLMELHELGPNRKFTACSNNSKALPALPEKSDLLLETICYRSWPFPRTWFVRLLPTPKAVRVLLSADDQYSVRQQKIGYYGSPKSHGYRQPGSTGIVVAGHWLQIRSHQDRPVMGGFFCSRTVDFCVFGVII